ncbi:unnamed protein product [Didymodactylos carnosus]|uniref:Pyrroline-5-carboxylate reductase n=1 Tax=Didymodactylos carnosus TaxID=1234261 RepID=A0A814B0U9_9BILA|nr:unnamed protein product [Didymodactylos carnosus]CAF0923011.1 unnamed protein product [Didymodactylos carnosus]CAF3700269.1 unnamed protein product [Didymodactylos carnosus]CAF3700829.1 unnamed protein product [Didymodactylos carnosus]
MSPAVKANFDAISEKVPKLRKFLSYNYPDITRVSGNIQYNSWQISPVVKENLKNLKSKLNIEIRFSSSPPSNNQFIFLKNFTSTASLDVLKNFVQSKNNSSSIESTLLNRLLTSRYLSPVKSVPATLPIISSSTARPSIQAYRSPPTRTDQNEDNEPEWRLQYSMEGYGSLLIPSTCIGKCIKIKANYAGLQEYEIIPPPLTTTQQNTNTATDTSTSSTTLTSSYYINSIWDHIIPPPKKINIPVSADTPQRIGTPPSSFVSQHVTTTETKEVLNSSPLTTTTISPISVIPEDIPPTAPVRKVVAAHNPTYLRFIPNATHMFSTRPYLLFDQKLYNFKNIYDALSSLKNILREYSNVIVQLRRPKTKIGLGNATEFKLILDNRKVHQTSLKNEQKIINESDVNRAVENLNRMMNIEQELMNVRNAFTARKLGVDMTVNGTAYPTLRAAPPSQNLETTTKFSFLPIFEPNTKNINERYFKSICYCTMLNRTIKRANHSQCRRLIKYNSTEFDYDYMYGSEKKMAIFRINYTYNINYAAIPFTEPQLISDWEGSFDIVEGDNFYRVCIVNGQPKPTIYVSFHNVNGKMYMQSVHVNITYALLEDSGYYVCHGFNYLKSKNWTFRLNVQSAPWFQQHVPTHVYAQKGSRLHIPCRAFGNPQPFIYWMHKSRFHDFLPVHYEILDIAYVRNIHEGVYRCRATNIHGIVDEDMVLLVGLTRMLLPQDSLILVSQWISSVYLPNNYYNFTRICDVQGYPPPEINIIFHSKQGYSYSLNNDILQINRVNWMHTGNYSCFATSSVSTKVWNLTLYVAGPPYRVLPDFAFSYPIELRQGQSWTTTCNVEGYPTPNYTCSNGHPDISPSTHHHYALQHDDSVDMADIHHHIQNVRIGLLGAGRMAQAIIRSLIDSKTVSSKNLIASDLDTNQLNMLKKETGIRTTHKNKEVVSESDILVLAVKPKDVENVLKNIYSTYEPHTHLLVSIAAGIRTATIEQQLKPKCRVVRVMPNVTCMVNASCSVYTRGTHATKTDIDTVHEMFSAIGTCEGEVDESLLNVVTGLSGSGPAYFSVIIDALADGAVKAGLSRTLALTLATKTMYGTAKMLLEKQIHPTQLKDIVASPGGTTIYGLEILEKAGFRAALMEAVTSATDRAKTLET